ncbi:hypothetical protein NDN01_00270 [Sphingomonas sp. QA11]|uniref:hypothetical protein n=1 Tax=Sphingomonas sp. QA11 TaxID=2950605 RepID=UPI00234B2F7B|nr:hypothetical protein [Sphingomonas sp. QA11]WCM27411.1 hypothetical protein NDN01_00270 [Sphingomonas sp. QA11]
MYKHVLSLAALAVGLVVATSPADAQARRGHVVAGRGAAGHGFAQWRSASRDPGSATVRRGLQTSNGHGYRHERSRDYGQGHYSADRSTQFNNGRGATTGRDANWGDGGFNGSRTTTLNNGNSFGRNTSAVKNADGTASYSTTLTGPRGGSRTVSGTVPRHR